MSDPLEAFSLPARTWFRETFGEPTPPQALGWPPIQRGEHTLILAPTGSGKTLAAFLWGIDELYREGDEGRKTNDEKGHSPSVLSPSSVCGLRLLYVSPLKALNNDIERNLRVPLAGIRHVAQRQGQYLPELRVAVRTGDTPQNARLAMLKHPPHILITTPESLYLMLTGPRSREMFRTVRTVIVDEIHTMCGNKRGVHLSLSLERLQHIADQPVQRLGLSATQRPLEEVARFLGGQAWTEERLAPRPVTIVDAGYRKPLDLQVVTVVPDFRALPGQSIWPHVVPHLAELIRQHRTTLIFCNNRRLAERTAERLNDEAPSRPPFREVRRDGASEQIALEAEGKVERGSAAALAPGGVPRGVGFAALGRSGGPIRAHHGSISKEARREMEEDLKAGRLPALVGTSSLELGIDIGSVDLVVQLQSPKAVAQGLQRVGRSGHLVGQTSVGRIFATHREDVMEAAAVARGMLRGDVEATRTPQDCLDVLAQQIVAMASLESWSVPALYNLVRQSYAYRDLSPRVWRSVLEMLAGKYYATGGREVALHRELRPRIAWDRVHDTIAALPGSRLLAVTNAGTIPDRGAFGAYLADGKTKIGELDEEFIFETRPGDIFVLGTHTWRVLDITTDRVIVADAAGSLPRMPFWRGDYPWREYELGLAVGRFRREVAERIEVARQQADATAAAYAEVMAWLRQECALDENSAYNVIDYVRTQMEAVGAISSDRTIVVESFQDAVGDRRMVVHSPFGGRVNGPWGLALASALRERTGVEVEVQTNDDGILLRFPGTDPSTSLRAGPATALRAGLDPPVDIIQNMTAAEARERILRELPNSAVFGAQFRMNAARALLLPGRKGGKRTPFWLQRLKAKDLLAVTRQFADFPIVAETYRDCLRDVMDLAHLEEVLAGIAQGNIRLVPVETAVPSPVAAGLLFNFISVYMYEWDTPKSEKQLAALSLHPELLQDLLKDVPLASLLKPEAFAETEGWLQHTAPASRARSLEELSLLLDDLGDLSAEEVAARGRGEARPWLASLAEQGRAVEIELPTAQGPARRWVPTELVAEYAAAFDLALSPAPPLPVPPAQHARLAILRRFLAHSGPVTTDDIRRRYAFPADWLSAALEELTASRQVAQGQFLPTPPLAGEGPGERLRVEWLDRRNLEQIHRRTITILRKEVQPVSLFAYADFLAHWQHLHPRERLAGAGGLTRVLQQLRAAPVPGLLWERDVLPARLSDFATDGQANLEAMCQSGELVWIGSGGKDPRRSRVRFFFRGEGGLFLEAQPSPDALAGLSAEGRAAFDYLKTEGACFFADLEAATGLESKALEAALVELVMAGLVTNDTLQAMREVVAFGGAGPLAPPRPLSALEVQLAERREALGLPHRPGALARPSRSRYAEAKRRVSERLQAERRWVGRWSLVHRAGVLGKPLPEEERTARQARQLLARYGVVTRDSLEREEGAWDWAALYPQLQLLELRGEVRRGYFIAGLPGVQFALPEAVERLRASGRAQPGPEDEELVVLNAGDPANVFGSEITVAPSPDTGPPSAGVATFRFARLPSTYVVLWRGQPILLAEDSGARLSTAPATERELLRQAVEALLAWLPRRTLPHRLTVTEWNDEPVLGGEGQALLESLGFYRDLPGMTWESR